MAKQVTCENKSSATGKVAAPKRNGAGAAKSALSNGKAKSAKTNIRDHVAKGNAYMLQGWELLTRAKANQD